MSNLATALAEFQSKLPRIVKTETAHVRSDKGSFDYSYADLGQISAIVMPLLGAVGLSFTARPTVLDGHFVLSYQLMHAEGETLDGIYPLPNNADPQKTGSAITYARRYVLCSLVGVAPDDEDDDGQAAKDTKVDARPRQARPRQAPERPAAQERPAQQAERPQPPAGPVESKYAVIEAAIEMAGSDPDLRKAHASIAPAFDEGAITVDEARKLSTLVHGKKAELEDAAARAEAERQHAAAEAGDLVGAGAST